MAQHPNPRPSVPELADGALHFLTRVQLTGQEARAFNHIIDWLEEQTVPEETPEDLLGDTPGPRGD